jgi:hypothetical protein
MTIPPTILESKRRGKGDIDPSATMCENVMAQAKLMALTKRW